MDVARISTVEAIPVRAPRARPMMSAAAHAPLTHSYFGIVRVRTSDGLEGLGEISMNASARGWRDGASHCEDVLRVLGPALVGADASDIQHACAVMDHLLERSQPAKAAIEMALFDAMGKRLGVPVYTLLGGRVRDRVPIRWGVPFGSESEVEELVGPWLERGVSCIKVKIGRPDPAADEAVVAHLRQRFGGHFGIVVDANEAFTSPAEAVRRIRPLEAHGLQLVEQPVRRGDLESLGEVRRRLSTPVLADESMRQWSDAHHIVAARAADVVAVYVSEAGGLLASIRASGIAEAAGLGVTIGSQCELGIGTAAMAHLGLCLRNLVHESDITGCLRYPVDVVDESVVFQGGTVRPTGGAGLGVTLNEEVLKEWRLDR